MQGAVVQPLQLVAVVWGEFGVELLLELQEFAAVLWVGDEDAALLTVVDTFA